MIEAIIFDFDGLILDTEEPEYRSWCEIYAEFGGTLSRETWIELVGLPWDAIAFDPYRHLEEQLGRSIERSSIQDRRRRRHLELIREQPILPGVEAWIAEAQQQGLGLAIASNSSRSWVTEHLDRLGLTTHFPHIACRDDVTTGKPDPAVYRTALQRLGVSASRALALEDSPTGVLAARRAGIPCVAVPSALTKAQPFTDAHFVLSSLSDMSLSRLLTEIQDP